MDSGEELFRFIHEMSKGEKRFFRLRAGTRADKNYLGLFDLILGMPEYDEEQLRRRFEEQGMGAQLSWCRNHLFDRLLESMRDFQLRNDVPLQVRHLISDARFLWSRGFGGKCNVLLRKAARLARRYELFGLQLEILEFERTIQVKRQERGYGAKMQAAIDAKDRALEQLRLQYELLDASQHFMLQARREEFGWKMGDEEEVLRTLRAELPPDAGFTAHRLQSFGLAVHAQLKGDFREAFEHYARIIARYEARPDFLRLQQRDYIFTLNNYLNLAFALGNYEPFADILARMEALRPGNPEEEAEIFQNSRFLRLLWYMNTARLSECRPLVAEIEQGMDRYGLKINPSRQLAFCLNIAFLGFVTGDYSMAWKWNQRILNSPHTESRRDIRAFASVFVLILAYQQGDLLYLDSLIHAAYQRQLRGKSGYPFEQLTVRFMKALVRTSGPEPRELVIRDWLQELELYHRKNPKHRAFGIAEIRLWLNSLLSGRPMAELLK